MEKKTFFPVGLLAAALLLWAGCGARFEYRGDDLVLERRGWDSLHVDISFVRSTAIGGDVPVSPDAVIVSVFDDLYEPVYEGGPGLIPLPDRSLGHRERLTVEACGIVRARQICIQEVVLASPKRVEVDEEIEYPTDGDMSDGRYAFTFLVERQLFESSAWERIDSADVRGYLLAWVNHPDGRRDGTVRIPFASHSGAFDLSRYANYKNFRYYLDSRLLDDEMAQVTFAIHAGPGNNVAPIKQVSKEILRKTEGERADDVRYFVEQATERLIDELGSFLGGRRAMAFVNEWEYNQLSRTYRVDMEAEWEGPIFNRRALQVEGVLEVHEDGSNARFRLRTANRSAADRWRDRVDGDEMTLGTVGVRRPDRQRLGF
ncbi:MAG: hypothetical protein WD021_06775 [Rhodothermales bacterium]